MRVRLDVPLGIHEICRAVNAAVPIETDIEAPVTHVTTDTRECCMGDLFFALPGENDSGEKYVDEALAKKCLVVSASAKSGTIRVDSTCKAILNLATAYKSKIAPRYTVAVTGSVGKSTTVKFTSKMLKQKFKVHSTVGNFNNHIGLPLTVFAMPKDTEVLLVELGMNHVGEISELSRAVCPNVAAITSVGTAHIGNLGSREAIAKAKLEILDGMHGGSVLLPAEEPLFSQVGDALYVGRNSSLSHFALNDLDNGGYTYVSRAKMINGISFFDKREHLLTDLAFALAISDLLGLSEKEMLGGAGAISEDDLRQRFIELGDFTILDDSYNASLESVIADLKFIASLKRPSGAFLGDILELGDSAPAIHERIGSAAANIGIDRLYLYGNHANDVARGALAGGMRYDSIFVNTDLDSPDVSVEQIYEHHATGEIILFKASHRLRLDKIADKIKLEKGR